MVCAIGINRLLTCKIVGCWMWWPLTKVNASACSGVTVQTPSKSDIKQCLGWIDGPNNCNGFVLADPTCNKNVHRSEWVFWVLWIWWADTRAQCASSSMRWSVKNRKMILTTHIYWQHSPNYCVCDEIDKSSFFGHFLYVVCVCVFTFSRQTKMKERNKSNRSIELTSIGSAPSLTRRPPSPLCVISTSIGPSRSTEALLLPLDTPSGFFLRLLGCESAGRRRTWNMMDPLTESDDDHKTWKQESKYNR